MDSKKLLDTLYEDDEKIMNCFLKRELQHCLTQDVLNKQFIEHLKKIGYNTRCCNPINDLQQELYYYHNTVVEMAEDYANLMVDYKKLKEEKESNLQSVMDTNKKLLDRIEELENKLLQKAMDEVQAPF